MTVQTLYALVHADRQTEADPATVTVIYSTNGEDWHPMATCTSADWGNDLVDALVFREQDRLARAAEAQRRLRDELHGGTACGCPGCEEGRP